MTYYIHEILSKTCPSICSDGVTVNHICIFVFLYKSVTLRVAGVTAETFWREFCE